ncbi:MAG: thiamine-phosphate kinase [Bryobacteraceae bacterium]
MKSELELVRWLRGQGRGIGDDCAVLPSPGRGEELLVTTDFLIEDVHFLSSHPAQQVGHRALARGLSDIAAMGGQPRWCLVSLALAEWVRDAWVKRFYEGLLGLAGRHKTALAGGDLSRSNRVTVDIVVLGTAPRGEALRRSGAKTGDAIYVSGVLGGCPALPEPRVSLGRSLRGRASACMDLSDGLSIDLHRLCAESGVAAAIDRPLPVAHGASLDDALNAGEDYELLFTSSRRIGGRRGLPVTRIGTVVRGEPGAMTLFGEPLRPGGWDHFRKT